MRYAYGLTSALLLGGAAISLATGFPAGAQVAQNDAAKLSSMVPRAGAPASFADLTAQLQPAVVNISTRQKVKVQNENPFAGSPFEQFFGGQGGSRTHAVLEKLGYRILHKRRDEVEPMFSRARIEAAMEKAGRKASAARPLAWIMVETNRQTFRHELRTRFWPGGGDEVLLGEAHAHGAWVEWYGK